LKLKVNNALNIEIIITIIIIVIIIIIIIIITIIIIIFIQGAQSPWRFSVGPCKL